MRRLVIGGALGVFLLSVVLAACGGSSDRLVRGPGSTIPGHVGDRSDREGLPRRHHDEGHRPDDEPVRAERDDHRRRGGDRVRAGRDPAVLVGEVAAFFEPENHWISDHPAYKLEITVNGDRGTLHFECHYVDAETGEVVAATAGDFDVARIDGKWLITNMVGGTTSPGSLRILRRGAGAAGRPRGAADGSTIRSSVPSPRLPVTVRTKLLIAFVGTSLLLVAVGLLGQIVLGRSNDRVGSLGALQRRAIAYGQLQRDAPHLRELLSENVGSRLRHGLERAPAGRVSLAVDRSR